eukprot:TRINITY_DN528_c0_g1_i1.p1 TRINITY_DN528_c0_g1~~TRINITY_DN528_c0_g1_i1.p1  ORF type:complete len:728 (+),score=37.95 TRINITY_DN528_c0_g1_i1:1595-3778(+)
MAEAAFYYLANYYQSWELLIQLSLQKPASIISQRVYNLHKILGMGMTKIADLERESDQTLDSMVYLKHYHKFLEQMEDSTDLTIKFWSILLEENPSSQNLNAIGKLLFNSKYKIIKTAERLSYITSNHIEFLIRYGLFMRLVMHDLVAAEQAFNKLVSLNDSSPSNFSMGGFSLFRTDVAVMLLIGSVESSGDCVIREINTEFEHSLGFQRKDLIGYPASKIMPPMVGSRHSEFVKAFFKTMKAQCIDIPKVRFVKNGAGYYVACRAMKRVVPKLGSDGLQIALFMICDNKILPYTCYRTDPTYKKAGMILCNHAYSIIGFSKEAVNILKLTEEDTNYFAKNSTLYDLFPILQRQEVLAEVTEKEGRVIAYSQNELSLGYINSDTERIIKKDNSPKETLLWTRLVTDHYGGIEKAHTLLISEILPDHLHEYECKFSVFTIIVIEGSGGIYANKVNQHIIVRPIKEKVKARIEIPETIQFEPQKMEEFSPAQSVASMASVGSINSSTTGAGLNEMVQEFQIQTMSRQTPVSIKRLFAGIIIMLVMTGALIGVSAYVSLKERNDLTQRFELIKEYESRYKMSIIINGMIKPTISLMILPFPMLDWLLDAFLIRTSTLMESSVKTRKILFKQGLDYDESLLVVPDPYEGQRTITFSHALLVVWLYHCQQTLVRQYTHRCNEVQAQRRLWVCADPLDSGLQIRTRKSRIRVQLNVLLHTLQARRSRQKARG